MNNIYLIHLLLFYGLFLICCGIAAVVFIGFKAKTALISGGTSGGIALAIAYAASQGFEAARYAGIGLSLFLFVIFSWRVTKTLTLLLKWTAEKHEEVNSKAIAFLIIGLMAIVTLFVFTLQVVL